MTRLVILDRDGVVNYDSDVYIRSAEQWIPIPGALEAIAFLSRAGFDIVIATNQAGVAKGCFSRGELDRIHEKMLAAVASAGGRLHRVITCTHHPDEKCSCRKPQPGMLLDACNEFHVDPADVCFVGDSLRDMQAAVAAGCQPVLVLSGNGEATRTSAQLPAHTRIYADLTSFARQLSNPSCVPRSACNI